MSHVKIMLMETTGRKCNVTDQNAVSVLKIGASLF